MNWKLLFIDVLLFSLKKMSLIRPFFMHILSAQIARKSTRITKQFQNVKIIPTLCITGQCWFRNGFPCEMWVAIPAVVKKQQKQPKQMSWLQLDGFRFVTVVTATCWSSNRASGRGRKEVEVTFWTDELVWVFHLLLFYWDFHTQQSQKRRNIKLLEENASLMSEVRVKVGRLVQTDSPDSGTNTVYRWSRPGDMNSHIF